MSQKHKVKIEEDVSPNLVPMIDIMFLLLLFFMLSADMGQRELEEVKLPMAASVKCAAYKAEQVCREENHWRVGIKGRDFSDPEKLGVQLQKEADSMRGQDPKNPHVSERRVMIRADDTAPYGLAQRAMNVCAKAGIYKIEVGAAQPPEEKKKRKG